MQCKFLYNLHMLLNMLRLPSLKLLRPHDLNTTKLFQVGDILLLCGTSKMRGINFIGQFLVRGKISPFTHIAVAYSAHSIADSNPKFGVRIRAWSDALEHYSINDSILLRNTNLSVEDKVELIARIHYYLLQPYNIISLINKNWLKQDGKGIVCSQFIATIFEELSLTVSHKKSYATLPIDIAISLFGSKEWSAFKMPYSIDLTDINQKLRLIGESNDRMLGAISELSQILSRLNQSIYKFSHLFLNLLDQSLFTETQLEKINFTNKPDNVINYAFELVKTKILVQPTNKKSTFLHENSHNYKTEQSSINEVLKFNNLHLSKNLPSIQNNLSELFKSLLIYLFHSSYDSQSITQDAGAVKNVYLILTDVIQKIDINLPLSDNSIELRQAELERLIDKLITMQHPERQEALITLESIAMIDTHYKQWKAQRANYIQLLRVLDDCLLEIFSHENKI